MSAGTAMTGGLCAARTRSGGTCRLPAGHGTDHVGIGRCRRHGGNTPTHTQSAAREVAVAAAKQLLGQDVEGDPTDVILEGVRLARGLTIYYRAMIAACDGDVPDAVEKGYAEAIERQTEMAYKASRAGVAERMVRLAERWADAISLVMEDAITAFAGWHDVEVSPEDRTRLAQIVQSGLGRYEEQPVIEGSASE